jgi:hypothetical protein
VDNERVGFRIPILGGDFRYTFGGCLTEDQRLVLGDNFDIVALTCTAWCSLLGDSPVGLKPARIVSRFVTKLEGDVFGTIAGFSVLAHQLSRSVTLDGQGGIIIDTVIPELFHTPIGKEYVHWLKTKDASVFKYINTFLNFGKKMSYEDPSLDALALRKWLEVEERIGVEPPRTLAGNIALIMRWLFRDFSPGEPFPKHGSGAVSERGVRGATEKCTSLVDVGVDPKVELLLRPYSDVLPGSTTLPVLLEQSTRSSMSRLKFVPKNWKTTRSICMEPVGFQYAQQMVRTWIEDHVKACPLKGHVFIEDQMVNQLACWHGSVSGQVDTIDLSSASDSVSFELVKQVFPPSVYRLLLATRSRTVELPDGSVHVPNKYAPMGSALCFPIQSVLYSAVVLAAAFSNLYGLDLVEDSLEGYNLDAAYTVCFGKNTPSWTSAFEPFFIYGDDIIVDTTLTSTVIRALISLHFEVNEEKSYTGKLAYRESCGIHTLNGYDVTPLVLKVKWFHRKVGVEALSSLIDAANAAYDEGYLTLRRTLINYVLYTPLQKSYLKSVDARNPVAFSADRDTALTLYSPTPRNTHLRKRTFIPGEVLSGRRPGTNITYQRDEVYRVMVGPEAKDTLPLSFDNYAYTLWWRGRQRSGESSDTLVDLKAEMRGKRLIQRWTAVP